MTRRVAWGTDAERQASRQEVGAHLARGGIVVYPTETVYGLGCVLEAGPLELLARFKGDRPFLVLIPGPDVAEGLRWTSAARRLADAFWPGPLTLALTAEAGRYPPQVMGPDGAVAVRVSPHPAIPPLLAAAGGPITSTSANAPGGTPAGDGDEAEVVARGVEGVGVAALVLDGGRLPEARPSTIVRCDRTTRIIREGAISRTDLESLVSLE